MASPTRYSLTIAIDGSLSSKLSKKYSLGCAWGVFYEDTDEPSYNIVGWSSAEVYQLNTVHWNEAFRASASDKGAIPGYYVDSITNNIPIRPGQTFTVKSSGDTTVSSDVPPGSKDSFLFHTELGKMSVVLDMGMDLGNPTPGENLTPIFIASDGQKPLLAPTDGKITLARKLIIFFAPKTSLAMRRTAFKTNKYDDGSFTVFGMQPIEYDYGKQDGNNTKVTLGYVDDRPAVMDIESYGSESRLMALPVVSPRRS